VRLFATPRDWSLLLLRLAVGGVLLPHGLQKTVGLFGGAGYQSTISYMTQQMSIPIAFAVLAIAAESLGALGLIFGCLTRVAAFAVVVEMATAVALVHWPNGFFMNWHGQIHGEGFEFHILMIAAALMLMIRGGGALSLDRAMGGAERVRDTNTSVVIRDISSREIPGTQADSWGQRTTP